MARSFFILLCVYALIGCTSQWIKSRADAQAFPLASQYCETDAEARFPVKNEVALRTRYVTRVESCTNKAECGNKKYKSAERQEIESYVMDVNSESRRSHFYQCMAIAGWESVTRVI